MAADPGHSPGTCKNMCIGAQNQPLMKFGQSTMVLRLGLEPKINSP